MAGVFAFPLAQAFLVKSLAQIAQTFQPVADFGIWRRADRKKQQSRRIDCQCFVNGDGATWFKDRRSCQPENIRPSNGLDQGVVVIQLFFQLFRVLLL